MSFKVEMICYKCNTDFKAEKETYPMCDEEGFSVEAICPECHTDCGTVTVSLTVK